MTSPVRRSFVLAVVGALLLGVSGLGAGRACGETTARRRRSAGIDVDASTIPELQAAMDAHKLTSRAAHPFYLHRIAEAEPDPQRGDHDQPDGPRATPAPRTRPAARGADLPLLGIPVLVKDNINTTGMPTTAGS